MHSSSVIQINFMSWGGGGLIFAREIIYRSGTDIEQSERVIPGAVSVLNVDIKVDARRALTAVHALLPLNHSQVSGHMTVVADFMYVMMTGLCADPRAGVNALDIETLSSYVCVYKTFRTDALKIINLSTKRM
jgi:hypothetical protein